MHQQATVAFGLAVLWGICATLFFEWLSGPVLGAVFWISEPALKRLFQSGWTADQIRPYFQWVTEVLPALFYGLAFGLPLGFFLRRPVIITWVIFVAAFLGTLAARMFLAQIDLRTSVGYVAQPLYWLTLLATLLFSFIGHRYRRRRRSGLAG